MDFGLYAGVAIVIVCIVFFCIFRRPIADLIGRIRSLSKDGFRMDASQKGGTPAQDPRAEAEKLMRELDSALGREVEGMITDALRQRALLGAEGVPVLIRYLAALSIAFSFEQVYRVIFGSQLNLLTYLNSEVSGQPIEVLRVFYTLAASQYPDFYNSYAFERWLGYLKDNTLVREDAGRLSITVRGREFLAYLTRTGYSLNKVG